MKPTVRTVVSVVLLGALTTNLGYLRFEVYELIAITSFFVLSATCLPFRKESPWAPLAISTVLLTILVLLFKITGQIPRMVLVGGVLFAAALDKKRADVERSEVSVLAVAVLVYGLYVLGNAHSDFVWHSANRLSETYSGFLGSLAAKNLLLSPSAGGVHTVVLLLSLYLSVFIMSQRRKLSLLARGLLITAALMGAFVLAGSAWEYPGHARPGSFVSSHFDLQALLVLAVLGVFWIEGPRARLRMAAITPAGAKAALAAAGAASLCLGILCLIVPEPVELEIRDGRKRVLFFDEGIMWGTPRFGWYGDRSGGMFGNLPRYLEFRGFEARRDTISEQSLEDADLLVAINLPQSFTETEHRLIWDFVREGGSLLCLGDHTGLTGIRDPFNALLRPMGIEFQFDSAKGFPESWVNAMQWRAHETTRVIEDESSANIWTGASLALGWGASPLVLGKFAWSDSGDVNKSDMAYLGDFRYGQGEQLGDIVLVAEARYGKGKVLVFGDTSTFQNGALVGSDEFAHGCFQWLCSPGKGEAFRAGRLAVGLILLVGAAVLIFLAKMSNLGIFLLTLTLLTAPLVGAFTGHPPPRTGEAEEEVAYIDKAHGERFDLYSWGEDSIGGLVYNLMRNGYLPFLQKRFDEKRLEESDLMLVMGPTRDFSPAEVRAVDGFVSGGNVLLVSMGYKQYKLAPSLMEHFGLTVRNTPLGPVETEGLGGPVRFYDAYPVESDDPDTTVVCEGYGFPLAVAKDWGDGRVVALGDTRFLQNKNLEGRETYIEENVMFLRRLASKLDREVHAR